MNPGGRVVSQSGNLTATELDRMIYIGIVNPCSVGAGSERVEFGSEIVISTVLS